MDNYTNYRILGNYDNQPTTFSEREEEREIEKERELQESRIIEVSNIIEGTKI